MIADFELESSFNQVTKKLSGGIITDIETFSFQLRRKFSVKSIKANIERTKSRLYGPNSRPPMRPRRDPSKVSDYESDV